MAMPVSRRIQSLIKKGRSKSDISSAIVAAHIRIRWRKASASVRQVHAAKVVLSKSSFTVELDYQQPGGLKSLILSITMKDLLHIHIQASERNR
jgi:hypothetical protein